LTDWLPPEVIVPADNALYLDTFRVVDVVGLLVIHLIQPLVDQVTVTPQQGVPLDVPTNVQPAQLQFIVELPVNPPPLTIYE
jgi:hypothetical protein